MREARREIARERKTEKKERKKEKGRRRRGLLFKGEQGETGREGEPVVICISLPHVLLLFLPC